MAAPDCRAGHGCRFPYPAHFHAEMMSFKKNGHTVWVQHDLQGVRDLLADPLLDGKALRKEPYQAFQLGDADDVFVSDVTHIRLAVKGKGVMFTERKEGDGSFHYLADTTVRFAMTFGLKDSQQLWVAVIAFCRIKECFDKSPWCIFRGRGIQIQSKC